jgi:hypothetical protein
VRPYAKSANSQKAFFYISNFKKYNFAEVLLTGSFRNLKNGYYSMSISQTLFGLPLQVYEMEEAQRKITTF